MKHTTRAYTPSKPSKPDNRSYATLIDAQILDACHGIKVRAQPLCIKKLTSNRTILD